MFPIAFNKSRRLSILKKISVFTVYTTIFLCLVTFSILSGLYLDVPLQSIERWEQDYSTDNVNITPVTCGFPVSGQYGRLPVWTCYVLLAATILVRGNKRLAAGAAASAMTFSGNAAVHLMILFATNDKLRLPDLSSQCDFLFIPGIEKDLPVCKGTYEPDYYYAVDLVSASLLASLPMAIWSKTFRNANDKSVIIMWILLLALSHIFYNITSSDVSPHFQICPAENVEILPIGQYQAVSFDDAWRLSFQHLVSDQNTTAYDCIYSCFGPAHRLGRKTQDVTVYDALTSRTQYLPSHRRLSVAFWLFYAGLAALTLFAERERAQQPLWTQRRLFTWRPFWLQQSKGPQMVTPSVLFRGLSRLLGIIAFPGYISLAQSESAVAPYSESVAAVGQWGAMTAVLLVVAAAVIHKISQMFNGVDFDNPDEDDEFSDLEWGCGCGYAS